jgi:probable 2-oxoglutarate dehydrogenase E1 component DHKTD1
MGPGTSFQPVLGDSTIEDASQVEKVVFVSGKFYYDLVKEREHRGMKNRMALVRIEVRKNKNEEYELCMLIFINRN